MAAYSEMQPAGARENEEIRGEKNLRTVTQCHLTLSTFWWQETFGRLVVAYSKID